MKKKLLSKIIFTLLITIAVIAINSNVLATNENITILQKTAEEYVIYLNSSLDKEFEFAYANEELNSDETLDYIKCAKDSEEGACIAYIDANLYEKFFKDAETTYLWAKSGENYLAKGIKLDLKDVVTEEIAQFADNTTKRISVKTDGKDVVTNVQDGIKYTTTTGKIEITDNEKAEYYYVMTNVTTSEEYSKLMELAEKINKSEALNTAERLNTIKEFYDLYSKLLSEVNDDSWTKVENMQIAQPKESKTGDQYIVWIKQETASGEVNDIQLMTCYQDEDKEFIQEEQVIKTTSKLPITYDSIALFVVLAVAVVLFVVLIVVRNKNKKDSNK